MSRGVDIPHVYNTSAYFYVFSYVHMLTTVCWVLASHMTPRAKTQSNAWSQGTALNNSLQYKSRETQNNAELGDIVAKYYNTAFHIIWSQTSAKISADDTMCCRHV